MLFALASTTRSVHAYSELLNAWATLNFTAIHYAPCVKFVSKMDEKYVVTPLNTADFLELSKTYTRNSGDVEEFIEITLNAIKAMGKKQIKVRWSQ